MAHSLAATVSADRERVLDWRDKAVIPAWYGSTIADVSGTTTLAALSTPMFSLDAGRVAANIERMQAWCDARGLSLAPHGKTTMAPALWLQQLDAGAWAITIANEAQLRVAVGCGVRRILLANVLLRADALRWLHDILDADPALEVLVWADSVRAVDLLNTGYGTAGRPLPVLVELGSPGARTGCRTSAEAHEIVDAIVAAPGLRFAGVAGYEGAVEHATHAAALASVDAYLATVVDLSAAVNTRIETPDAILTLGGSTYFDRVAAAVVDLTQTRVVLRSGAYVAHDDGLYRAGTPTTRNDGPELQAAIHAWARVVSVPEPALALLDTGRRDLSFDSGLPEVQSVRKADGSIVELGEGYRITKLNDQHAFVSTPVHSALEVGDVVRLGLSHPCTVFDKWALIPVIDDSTSADPLVVDLIPTYF